MKEYLEYLEKLNSLVDTNELERVRDDCQRQKLHLRKLGRLRFIAVLLTVGLLVPAYDGLGKLLRLALYGEKYNVVDSLLWLILFMVVFGFTLWIVAFYSVDEEKLNSMLGISYVNHSYAAIRNTIIDEGEEFMRKLFIWERLYTLTVDDKRKYDYVLKVIYNLGLEYTRFETKGV
jgi:hypothetical protein